MGDAIVVLNATGRCDGLLLDALAEVVGIVVAVLLQAVIPTSPYTVTIKTKNQLVSITEVKADVSLLLAGVENRMLIRHQIFVCR